MAYFDFHWFCVILFSQKGDIDEEVLGHLRSAAGKARLLATKKFKQFEGIRRFSFLLSFHFDQIEIQIFIA